MTQPAPPPLTIETEVDRLQRQLAEARADLQRHGAALSKLQGEFMASRLQVSDAHANLRAAQAHIDELRAHAAGFEAELAGREVEIIRLHAAHADLERMLNSMRASRSWRISAPIRLAGNLLRGGTS